MYRVDLHMKRAVEGNIFPGAVLLVVGNKAVEFYEAYGCANLLTKEKMTLETIFDLASLTKPLATTLAVLKYMESTGRKFEFLVQTLGEFLPELKNTAKDHITLEMLLRHTSGYPAHRPYYEELAKLPQSERCKRLLTLLKNEPLVNPVGLTTLYSDLGFMLLGEIFQRIADSELDHYLSKNVYDPLGLVNLYFIRHFEKLRPGRYAATEVCPFRKILLSGQVHDDNAHALGGVCGHAGLFGTAQDIMVLLTSLSQAYHDSCGQTFFSPLLVRRFLARSAEGGRPLGFDVPTLPKSSSGKWFSPKTVGHLGFTGTSFWMDLAKEIIVILLTNRVHPHRNNDGIRAFRPLIHNEIMAALGADK